MFFSQRVHLCGLTYALRCDCIYFVLIYDVFKTDDPVLYWNFKLDYLFIQTDVFYLELAVIFFYFLGIFEDFINLFINVGLRCVDIFCNLEFTTLDDEKMAYPLPLHKQVGSFYGVAWLEFWNQLFYSALVQIFEQGEALQVVLFFVFDPCVVLCHNTVEILFADDENVTVSCRVHSCGSRLWIQQTIYTKEVTCG